jgi:hypothetical protein
MLFSRPAACGCGAVCSFLRAGFGARWVLSIVSVAAIPFAQASDSAPVISGTPAASVLATKPYSFQPRATDANHDRLTFSIRNKPSWAGFDSQTGRLYGTPARWNAGTFKNITIAVSDGKLSSTLRAFTVKVVALIDHPPPISGKPPGSVTVGQSYYFQPSSSDADGDRITFSVRNKPSWLSLNSSTGRLQGVPSSGNAGTYKNIILTASDGYSAQNLPAFSIVVAAPRTASAATDTSVTMQWTPPTENVDASALTNLAGYHLHYGSTPKSLTHVITISNPGLTRYVVDNLAAGPWYFALTAYTRDGRESSLSATVGTVIQ